LYEFHDVVVNSDSYETQGLLKGARGVVVDVQEPGKVYWVQANDSNEFGDYPVAYVYHDDLLAAECSDK
jgi:hypothetical protein